MRRLGGKVWGAGVPLPSRGEVWGQKIFSGILCEIMHFCALLHRNITIGELCLGGLTFSLGAEAPPKPMPGYVDVWLVLIFRPTEDKRLS